MTIAPLDVESLILPQLLSIADASALLSPPLGGVIYVYGGRLCLVITSLVILGVALIITALVNEDKDGLRAKPTITQDVGKPLLSNVNEAQSLLSSVAVPIEATSADARYVLQPSQNSLVRKAPIILCLKDYRFIGTIALCFVQSSLAGAFEAVLPLEGEALFGFSPEKAGYLFIPLGVARYTCGIVGGWAVDRYGPRKLALSFYMFQAPVLLMFHLLRPTPRVPQIALMCFLLTLTGMCMAAVGTVSFVESSNIMDRYSRSNSHIFGDRSPFAALTGLTIMVWALGTSTGSLIAGEMRLMIGFGKTMAIFAVFSVLGVAGSYFCLEPTSSTTQAENSNLVKNAVSDQ